MPPASEAVPVTLILGGMLAFCFSYWLAVKKQEFLLGNLTRLWFRTLTWIVVGGLVLLCLDAATRLAFTLFWRHSCFLQNSTFAGAAIKAHRA